METARYLCRSHHEEGRRSSTITIFVRTTNPSNSSVLANLLHLSCVMEVINLISDQEEYDEEVTFVVHHVNTKRRPFRETTNNKDSQLREELKQKEVCCGVEVETAKIGIKPLEDYPHFRFQCEVNKLSTANESLYCERCFCFVCDEPATRCQKWATHCSAIDTLKKFVNMREQTLRRRTHETRSAFFQGSRGLPR